jgi:hypothetical protein
MMIINKEEWTFSGMNDEEGLNQKYRDDNGNLTKQYRRQITNAIAYYASEFEISLKAFYYNFPKEGNYKISWKIERLDDDNN